MNIMFGEEIRAGQSRFESGEGIQFVHHVTETELSLSVQCNQSFQKSVCYSCVCVFMLRHWILII